MATREMSRVLRHLRAALRPPGEAGLTDAGLLTRFLQHRDEAAFAALVRRHGPMVLGVCRRLLGNVHDAEDAFQATFLVLVRKAGSVRPRELVANWLYGVAYQTARKARAVAARRRGRERQVRDLPEPAARAQEPWPDLRPLLDRELNGLPEKYRAPVVLCDLEGKSRKEAARQLGWLEGTLDGRLARARALLARRLGRRGLALAGGSLAAGWAAEAASAAVPGPLLAATVRTGSLLAAGRAAAACVAAPQAAALMEGVLHAMLLTKVKVAAAVLLVAGVLGAGAVGVRHQTRADGPAGADAAAGSGGAARDPAQAGPGDHEKVWTLDFSFDTPDFRVVTERGKGKRVFLCLRYKVVNRTGKAHPFIPSLDLQVAGDPARVPDQVVPGAAAKIAAAVDPAGRLRLRDSVAIAREPIPPARAGDPDAGVHGLALWENVDLGVPRFSIFVAGLSSAWVVTEPGQAGKKPVVRRKVLQLNFKQVGNRIVFVPPRQWLYSARVAAGRDPAPADLLEEQRQRQTIERQREVDRAKDGIAVLEKRRQHWREERDQLRAGLRAWLKAVGDGPSAVGAERLAARQAVVKAVHKLLDLGDQEDLKLQVDLDLLQKRLNELERGQAPRPVPAPRDLQGTVEEVDGAMLLLAVGAAHAVRKGERLEIYRVRPRPEYVGQADVVAVVGRRAVARFVRTQSGRGPRVGDQVARSLRGGADPAAP
jgi:RNA polymerase sigma factor (sigma-70 family)